MHLYGGTVAELARHTGDEAVIAASEQRFTKAFGQAPSAQEVQSWRRSWPALVKVLQDAGLGELYVLLEYCLPATGERVDALLLGTDTNGHPCAVAIELKQWTHVRLSGLRPGMVRTGEAATNRTAVAGPTPGAVMSRRATGSALATAASSRSAWLISPLRSSIIRSWRSM